MFGSFFCLSNSIGVKVRLHCRSQAALSILKLLFYTTYENALSLTTIIVN
jgi:hypothetical protein